VNIKITVWSRTTTTGKGRCGADVKKYLKLIGA